MTPPSPTNDPPEPDKNRPALIRLARLALTLILGGAPSAAPVLHAASDAPTSPVVTSVRFDAEGRFVVEVATPAGARHAVLEVRTRTSQSPEEPTTWRAMIAGAIDGRSAEVAFRLPKSARHGAPNLLARVRTGTAESIPPAELSDPALFAVSYPGGSGPLPEQAKIDLLELAGARMREWDDLAWTERQDALIAWAESDPRVADAGVSVVADNVWMRFTDGDVAVLLNRQRTDGSIPPHGIPLGRQIELPHPDTNDGVRTLGSTAPTGLPGSRTAVCAYSLESATFPNSAPTIAGWLSAAGFHATTANATTVGDIKAWSSSASPLGILFWQAHGCSYPKADGTEGVGIVTREFATRELSQGAYKDMRDSGELLLAKDDTPNPPMYYLTSSFVRNHLHFAPHSIVVLDTCYAAHSELADAFLNQGSGAFAGWNWEAGIRSTTPILKIFDRLVGANEEPPVSSPPERPFALPIVRQWMEQSGYDFDPSPKYPNQTTPNARIIWHVHPDKPAHILRPTIMRILHEYGREREPFTKFLIEGDFGADPGESKRRVLWGGGEMQVLRWDQNDGIVIRPPADPPTGSFEVVIDPVHRSNLTPMTEWTVPFSYEYQGYGSLNYRVDLTMRIRADVHGSRGMPEQPVQYLPTHFGNLGDCTGKVAASGLYQPSPESFIAWSGGTSMTSVDPETPGAHLLVDHVSTGGTINLLTGNIENFGLVSTGRFTESTDTGSRLVGAQVAILSWPPPTPRINLGNHALVGDRITLVSPVGTGSATLSWPTVHPVPAPTPETVR